MAELSLLSSRAAYHWENEEALWSVVRDLLFFGWFKVFAF